MHAMDAPDDDWRDRALCTEVDPEMFFPEKGGSALAAKRICAKCEVREDCLLWALEHDERQGIWGGKTRPERARMRPKGRPGRKPKEITR